MANTIASRRRYFGMLHSAGLALSFGLLGQGMTGQGITGQGMTGQGWRR